MSAYKSHCISEECISCGACSDVCPYDAIIEDDDQYHIDKTKCRSCVPGEPQCVPVCPVEAIAPCPEKTTGE